MGRAASDGGGEQGGSAGAEHALEVGSGRDGVGDQVGAAGGEQARQLEAPPGFGQRPPPPAVADRIGSEHEPFVVRVGGVGAFGPRHGGRPSGQPACT